MNILKRLWLMCLLTQGGNLYAQQIGLNLPKDSTKVSFSFQVANSMVIIPVGINGKLVLPFILDTSVEFTTLTNKSLGDEMGFNYLRKMVLAQSPEGLIHGYSANELYYELPGGVFTGDNHSMMVLDYDFLGLSTLAQSSVYGLIGRDIFSRFVVDINMDKQLLTLHEPKSFTPPAGYEAVPLKIEDGKVKLAITTVFENWEKQTTYFSVKTGAPHTVFIDSDQNIYNVPPRKVETVLGKGNTGDVYGAVGRVREIVIGKSRFENALASFTKDQINGMDRSSVGMGLLSRFNMIVDFQGGTIYLRPNKTFTKLFEFDLSGIKISPIGDGRFYIDFVQQGSPAAQAGLQVGDQVVSINEAVLTDENFAKTVLQLNDRPDKKITLKILQGDVQKEVSFKLIRFI